MWNSGQVNNAGITGAVVTDPDGLGSVIAAAQVNSSCKIPLVAYVIFEEEPLWKLKKSNLWTFNVHAVDFPSTSFWRES